MLIPFFSFVDHDARICEDVIEIVQVGFHFLIGGRTAH
ncbi:MAG: hypothetical protein RIU71_1437, partial [Pseudomonadota bacterium]